jgi:1-acyl-sn-glycerol-3-phosphate acyltransferase
MLKIALARIYGAYAITAFVMVVLMLFCPLLIIAPTLSLRREIGRAAVRTWLAVIFVPFRVRGLQNLPPEPCIALCNHASYVDGILFTAALPSRFTFLVQHRAADWPYVGLIIRRMGVTFVNRESAAPAARAVLGLIRHARNGGSVAIFPEGTFRKEPGLLPFFGGAFLIAAKAGIPVMPAVMRGTRHFFAEGQKLPRWSSIDVEFLEPIAPLGMSTKDAEALGEAAHNVMRRHCGELDDAQTRIAAQNAPTAEHSSKIGVNLQ